MTVYAWAVRFSSRMARFWFALFILFGLLDEHVEQRRREDVAEAIRELGEDDDGDEDGGRDE